MTCLCSFNPMCTAYSAHIRVNNNPSPLYCFKFDSNDKASTNYLNFPVMYTTNTYCTSVKTTTEKRNVVISQYIVIQMFV